MFPFDTILQSANRDNPYHYDLWFLFRTTHKIQSINNIKNQWNEWLITGTPAPNNDPDVSGEVQKARMAQALRAFLCLSLSEGIRLNPVFIGIRFGIR